MTFSRWIAPLFLVALLMQGCATVPAPAPPPAPAAADPYPIWPTDGCGYWTRSQGHRFFFEAGRATPNAPDRVDILLDAFVASWREDGGLALIDAHADRAEAIKTRLIGRGIPAGRIWVRTHGDRELVIPTPPGAAELQNRRMELRNPFEGYRCIADRRRSRVEWFQRNCYPARVVTVEAGFCAKALEDIRRGDVGSI